jgi:hypothetical protein
MDQSRLKRKYSTAKDEVSTLRFESWLLNMNIQLIYDGMLSKK